MTEEELNKSFWETNRRIAEINPDMAKIMADMWKGLSILRESLTKAIEENDQEEEWTN